MEINTREKRNEQINIKKSYMRILTQDFKIYRLYLYVTDDVPQLLNI